MNTMQDGMLHGPPQTQPCLRPAAHGIRVLHQILIKTTCWSRRNLRSRNSPDPMEASSHLTQARPIDGHQVVPLQQRASRSSTNWRHRRGALPCHAANGEKHRLPMAWHGDGGGTGTVVAFLLRRVLMAAAPGVRRTRVLLRAPLSDAGTTQRSLPHSAA